MEKHPIEKWDHLVCNSLYPAKLKNDLADKGRLNSFLEESKEAREQVRSNLIREAVLCKSSQAIKVLVQQYQAFFCHLMDIVFDYKSEAEISFELQKVYEQVANDLEIIISFIENSYPNYFNQHFKVPAIIRAKFEKSLKPQFERIKKRLGEIERNQPLIESVFAIIENYIQPSLSDVSFHHLSYIKTLVSTVSNWNAEINRDSKFSPAIELLIALKFNDERFLKIVIKTIKESIAALESEDEQFRLLKEYYKNTSQIIEYGTAPLFTDQPSPKNVILDWLSQEIYFLETCYPKKENTAAASSAKINTSLSVPVLALYIRLFKESGIITNSNSQELFRAVSSTFTTNRKAEVANSHLYSKFYAIEESSKRKVFDQLMEMAHLCKRIG